MTKAGKNRGQAGGLITIDTPRRIALADYNPDDTGGLSRAEAEAAMPDLESRLQRIQDLLYGAAHQAVLVILQGMDTSGKDGTIKHVMASVNPTGCQVWEFKQPSAEELAHDYLWRVHRLVPPKGILGIFNRSHYEDVLVVRVHELVPREVWRERYDQINQFERMLARNGTILLKFYLHISKDEQKRRLLDREKDVDTAWKLSLGDWEERAYWDAYQKAYEDALGKCGTAWAPWYIIPANAKWYRNYLVARALVECLEPLTETWTEELRARGKEALRQITEARAHEK